MNYHRIYFMIVNRASRAARAGLVEKHHVVPRCMGGNNINSPIAPLTPKEHFVCHHLLTKMYPNNDKLKFAFWAMCNQRHGDAPRQYRVSSNCYDAAKRAFVQINSRLHKGKQVSQHHKNISRKLFQKHNPHKPGKDSYLYGIPRTEDVKRKISETIRRKQEHKTA